MAQLPGTIHIKRKLVEEPPETLYIEREGYHPDPDDHNARPIYRLVQVKRPRISHGAPPDIYVDRIPDVPATKTPAIATNDTDASRKPSPALNEAQDDRATVTNTSKINNQKSFQARRIFHLAVTKGSPLSRVSSASSIHSLSRRRGKHGSGIAVFTERRAKRVDQMARSIINSRPETPGSADERSGHNLARKRPSANSQTSKGLTPSSSILFDKDEDIDANLKLAKELQEFTLETLTPSSDVAQPAVTSTESLRKKPMKYQPKPPRPRPARMVEDPAPPSVEQDPLIAKDTMVQDGSDEWVYDVYVRDIIQPPTQAKNQSAEPRINGTGLDQNVGVIVIRQEDEAALEEFMSDDSGSEQWGEDDEDSNAEDYYANDYPDELDSGDEWNIGGRSDDEDALEDNYYMSDGERD